MFFVLSKILDFFLQPISWLIFTILIILISRNNSLKRKLILFNLFLSVLFTNGKFTNYFYNCWEINYPNKINQIYPVGIVLTGGIIQNSGLSNNAIHFSTHADRLMQAVLLYKKGIIKKIMISGGNVRIKGDLINDFTDESLKCGQFLKILGVPDSCIIIESSSKNTHENAVFSKIKLKENGIFTNKIALITSSYHMKRASACFKKEGILHDVYPAIKIGKDASTGILSDFVPDEHNIYLNAQLIREIVGFYVYKFMNYC
ncbi:MAG: hypothetical protein RJA76_1915 [Bacteroidota bacterium]|jgi:uncharacterized SAM-binding protein YcdF (DUF218 family)